MEQITHDIEQFIRINEYATLTVYNFRKQYFYTGWKYQSKMLELLESNLNRIIDYSGEDAVDRLGIAMVLQASENQDHILLADVIENSVIPFLQSIIQIIEQNISVNEFNYYEANIRALNRNGMSDVADIVNNATPMKGHQYKVEYTSSGYLTIKIVDNDSDFYISGNNNPLTDAFSFVSGNIQEDYYKYIIFGAGMFFEAKAMLEQRPDIEIQIVEEDQYLLKLALTYTDVTELIDSGLVKLACRNYVDYVSERDFSNQKIIVRKPSIRHMQDNAHKAIISRFFMSSMSLEEQKYMLKRNFRHNTKDADSLKSVDECRELIQGKRIYLIAGGPSFDNSIEMLVDRPDESIVMCVGTSASKLMKKGIIPDIVIITDAQEAIYQQIINVLDENKTKLFYLSTVYYKVVDDFLGEKYIICQKGMSNAEEIAIQKGYTCFETGGSVSTTALDVCLRLEASEIICMGLDLAFTNNMSHASDTLDNRSIVDAKFITQKVRGVRGDYLETSENLHSYHVWIERRIENEQDVRMINISNGAYIRGMINESI